MFPKEIIEILQKYQDSNNTLLNDINNNISNIIEKLYSINQNLAERINSLILDKNANNNVSEIVEDSITLRNYIESIQFLNIKEISLNNLSTEISEEIVPNPTNIMPKPVKLYLCEDNVCPECDCNMDETYTIYSQKVNETFIQHRISSYKCGCCHKYFIPDYDIVDIDITETNLKFDTKYYNKITLFDDVYVVTNINYHSSQNHKLEDIDGKLNLILSNGEITTRVVNITYCDFCKKYYMLKSTYDNLTGVPVCSIIDETKVKQENSENFIFDTKGSKLTQYGYNVNCIDKLTDSQRRKILMIQLLSKNMQRNEIISILETNIERAESMMKNQSKRDMSNALQKWKDDKNFVSKVIIEECNKQIDIYRLILKYRKH